MRTNSLHSALENVPIPRAIPHETVLVVEDEDDVRVFAISVLEDLGYRVLAVSDGENAITALRQQTRIDILFTDVVWSGGMTGRQVADQGLALRPGYSRSCSRPAIPVTPSFTRVG